MNFETPLVTVRVPSYNHGRFIRQTILSIVQQTFQDFELIVIDDYSSDDSHEIISKLQHEYGFIYIRHEENKGITYSMNEFLTLAKGKYMAGCASDDYWEKDKLEHQVAFMETHSEMAVCYGRARQITEENEKLGEFPAKSYRSGWLFDDLITKKFSLIAPTTMMRIDALKEVKGYDSGFMEDFPMWLKLAEKHQFGYINKVLTNYRVHPGNLTKNFVKRLKYQKEVIDMYTHKSIYKEAILLWHLRCFMLYSRRGMEEAREHFWPASRFFYKKSFVLALLFYLKNVIAK